LPIFYLNDGLGIIGAEYSKCTVRSCLLWKEVDVFS
jgi:hypothetical protein